MYMQEKPYKASGPSEGEACLLEKVVLERFVEGLPGDSAVRTLPPACVCRGGCYPLWRIIWQPGLRG